MLVTTKVVYQVGGTNFFQLPEPTKVGTGQCDNCHTTLSLYLSRVKISWIWTETPSVRWVWWETTTGGWRGFGGGGDPCNPLWELISVGLVWFFWSPKIVGCRDMGVQDFLNTFLNTLPVPSSTNWHVNPRHLQHSVTDWFWGCLNRVWTL